MAAYSVSRILHNSLREYFRRHMEQEDWLSCLRALQGCAEMGHSPSKVPYDSLVPFLTAHGQWEAVLRLAPAMLPSLLKAGGQDESGPKSITTAKGSSHAASTFTSEEKIAQGTAHCTSLAVERGSSSPAMPSPVIEWGLLQARPEKGKARVGKGQSRTESRGSHDPHTSASAEERLVSALLQTALVEEAVRSAGSWPAVVSLVKLSASRIVRLDPACSLRATEALEKWLVDPQHFPSLSGSSVTGSPLEELHVVRDLLKAERASRGLQLPSSAMALPEEVCADTPRVFAGISKALIDILRDLVNSPQTGGSYRASSSQRPRREMRRHRLFADVVQDLRTFVGKLQEEELRECVHTIEYLLQRALASRQEDSTALDAQVVSEVSSRLDVVEVACRILWIDLDSRKAGVAQKAAPGADGGEPSLPKPSEALAGAYPTSTAGHEVVLTHYQLILASTELRLLHALNRQNCTTTALSSATHPSSSSSAYTVRKAALQSLAHAAHCWAKYLSAALNDVEQRAQLLSTASSELLIRYFCGICSSASASVTEQQVHAPPSIPAAICGVVQQLATLTVEWVEEHYGAQVTLERDTSTGMRSLSGLPLFRMLTSAVADLCNVFAALLTISATDSNIAALLASDVKQRAHQLWATLLGHSTLCHSGSCLFHESRSRQIALLSIISHLNNIPKAFLAALSTCVQPFPSPCLLLSSTAVGGRRRGATSVPASLSNASDNVLSAEVYWAVSFLLAYVAPLVVGSHESSRALEMAPAFADIDGSDTHIEQVKGDVDTLGPLLSPDGHARMEGKGCAHPYLSSGAACALRTVFSPLRSIMLFLKTTSDFERVAEGIIQFAERDAIRSRKALKLLLSMMQPQHAASMCRRLVFRLCETRVSIRELDEARVHCAVTIIAALHRNVSVPLEEKSALAAKFFEYFARDTSQGVERDKMRKTDGLPLAVGQPTSFEPSSTVAAWQAALALFHADPGTLHDQYDAMKVFEDAMRVTPRGSTANLSNATLDKLEESHSSLEQILHVLVERTTPPRWKEALDIVRGISVSYNSDDGVPVVPLLHTSLVAAEQNKGRYSLSHKERHQLQKDLHTAMKRGVIKECVDIYYRLQRRNKILREEELDWFASAVRRGPLTFAGHVLQHGQGGVGKRICFSAVQCAARSLRRANAQHVRDARGSGEATARGKQAVLLVQHRCQAVVAQALRLLPKSKTFDRTSVGTAGDDSSLLSVDKDEITQEEFKYLHGQILRVCGGNTTLARQLLGTSGMYRCTALQRAQDGVRRTLTLCRETNDSETAIRAYEAYRRDWLRSPLSLDLVLDLLELQVQAIHSREGFHMMNKNVPAGTAEQQCVTEESSAQDDAIVTSWPEESKRIPTSHATQQLQVTLGSCDAETDRRVGASPSPTPRGGEEALLQILEDGLLFAWEQFHFSSPADAPVSRGASRMTPGRAGTAFETFTAEALCRVLCLEVAHTRGSARSLLPSGGIPITACRSDAPVSMLQYAPRVLLLCLEQMKANSVTVLQCSGLMVGVVQALCLHHHQHKHKAGSSSLLAALSGHPRGCCGRPSERGGSIEDRCGSHNPHYVEFCRFLIELEAIVEEVSRNLPETSISRAPVLWMRLLRYQWSHEGLAHSCSMPPGRSTCMQLVRDTEYYAFAALRHDLLEALMSCFPQMSRQPSIDERCTQKAEAWEAAWNFPGAFSFVLEALGFLLRLHASHHSPVALHSAAIDIALSLWRNTGGAADVCGPSLHTFVQSGEALRCYCLTAALTESLYTASRVLAIELQAQPHTPLHFAVLGAQRQATDQANEALREICGALCVWWRSNVYIREGDGCSEGAIDFFAAATQRQRLLWLLLRLTHRARALSGLGPPPNQQMLPQLQQLMEQYERCLLDVLRTHSGDMDAVHSSEWLALRALKQCFTDSHEGGRDALNTNVEGADTAADWREFALALNAWWLLSDDSTYRNEESLRAVLQSVSPEQLAVRDDGGGEVQEGHHAGVASLLRVCHLFRPNRLGGVDVGGVDPCTFDEDGILHGVVPSGGGALFAVCGIVDMTCFTSAHASLDISTVMHDGSVHALLASAQHASSEFQSPDVTEKLLLSVMDGLSITAPYRWDLALSLARCYPVLYLERRDMEDNSPSSSTGKEPLPWEAAIMARVQRLAYAVRSCGPWPVACLLEVLATARCCGGPLGHKLRGAFPDAEEYVDACVGWKIDASSITESVVLQWDGNAVEYLSRMHGYEESIATQSATLLLRHGTEPFHLEGCSPAVQQKVVELMTSGPGQSLKPHVGWLNDTTSQTTYLLECHLTLEQVPLCEADGAQSAYFALPRCFLESAEVRAAPKRSRFARLPPQGAARVRHTPLLAFPGALFNTHGVMQVAMCGTPSSSSVTAAGEALRQVLRLPRDAAHGEEPDARHWTSGETRFHEEALASSGAFTAPQYAMALCHASASWPLAQKMNLMHLASQQEVNGVLAALRRLATDMLEVPPAFLWAVWNTLIMRLTEMEAHLLRVRRYSDDTLQKSLVCVLEHFLSSMWAPCEKDGMPDALLDDVLGYYLTTVIAASDATGTTVNTSLREHASDALRLHIFHWCQGSPLEAALTRRISAVTEQLMLLLDGQPTGPMCLWRATLWPPTYVERVRLHSHLQGKTPDWPSSAASQETVLVLRNPNVVATALEHLVQGELQLCSYRQPLMSSSKSPAARGPLVQASDFTREYMENGAVLLVQRKYGHHILTAPPLLQSMPDAPARIFGTGGGLVLDRLFLILSKKQRAVKRRGAVPEADLISAMHFVVDATFSSHTNQDDSIQDSLERTRGRYEGYVPSDWSVVLPLLVRRNGLSRRNTATAEHLICVARRLRMTEDWALYLSRASSAAGVPHSHAGGLRISALGKKDMQELLLFFLRGLHQNITFINPLGWHAERQASLGIAWTCLMDFLQATVNVASSRRQTDDVLPRDINLWSPALEAELEGLFGASSGVGEIVRRCSGSGVPLPRPANLSDATTPLQSVVLPRYVTVLGLLLFFSGAWRHVEGRVLRSSEASSAGHTHSMEHDVKHWLREQVCMVACPPELSCEPVLGEGTQLSSATSSIPLRRIVTLFQRYILQKGVVPSHKFFMFLLDTARDHALASSGAQAWMWVDWGLELFLCVSPYMAATTSSVEKVALLVGVAWSVSPSGASASGSRCMQTLHRLLRHTQHVPLTHVGVATMALLYCHMMHGVEAGGGGGPAMDETIHDGSATHRIQMAQWILWRCATAAQLLTEADLGLAITHLSLFSSSSASVSSSLQCLRDGCLSFLARGTHESVRYDDPFVHIGMRLHHYIGVESSSTSHWKPFLQRVLEAALTTNPVTQRPSTHKVPWSRLKHLYVKSIASEGTAHGKWEDKLGDADDPVQRNAVIDRLQLLTLVMNGVSAHDLSSPNQGRSKGSTPLSPVWQRCFERNLRLLESATSGYHTPREVDGEVARGVVTVREVESVYEATIVALRLLLSGEAVHSCQTAVTLCGYLHWTRLHQRHEKGGIVQFLYATIQYLSRSATSSVVPTEKHVALMNLVRKEEACRLSVADAQRSGNRLCALDQYARCFVKHPHLHWTTAVQAAEALKGIEQNLRKHTGNSEDVQVTHLGKVSAAATPQVWTMFSELYIDRLYVHLQYENVLRFAISIGYTPNSATQPRLSRAATVVAPSAVTQVLQLLKGSPSSVATLDAIVGEQLAQTATLQIPVLQQLLQGKQVLEAAALCRRVPALLESSALRDGLQWHVNKQQEYIVTHFWDNLFVSGQHASSKPGDKFVCSTSSTLSFEAVPLPTLVQAVKCFNKGMADSRSRKEGLWRGCMPAVGLVAELLRVLFRVKPPAAHHDAVKVVCAALQWVGEHLLHDYDMRSPCMLTCIWTSPAPSQATFAALAPLMQVVDQVLLPALGSWSGMERQKEWLCFLQKLVRPLIRILIRFDAQRCMSVCETFIAAFEPHVVSSQPGVGLGPASTQSDEGRRCLEEVQQLHRYLEHYEFVRKSCVAMEARVNDDAGAAALAVCQWREQRAYRHSEPWWCFAALFNATIHRLGDLRGVQYALLQRLAEVLLNHTPEGSSASILMMGAAIEYVMHLANGDDAKGIMAISRSEAAQALLTPLRTELARRYPMSEASVACVTSVADQWELVERLNRTAVHTMAVLHDSHSALTGIPLYTATELISLLTIAPKAMWIQHGLPGECDAQGDQTALCTSFSQGILRLLRAVKHVNTSGAAMALFQACLQALERSYQLLVATSNVYTNVSVVATPPASTEESSSRQRWPSERILRDELLEQLWRDGVQLLTWEVFVYHPLPPVSTAANHLPSTSAMQLRALDLLLQAASLSPSDPCGAMKSVCNALRPHCLLHFTEDMQARIKMTCIHEKGTEWRDVYMELTGYNPGVLKRSTTLPEADEDAHHARLSRSLAVVNDWGTAWALCEEKRSCGVRLLWDHYERLRCILCLSESLPPSQVAPVSVVERWSRVEQWLYALLRDGLTPTTASLENCLTYLARTMSFNDELVAASTVLQFAKLLTVLPPLTNARQMKASPPLSGPPRLQGQMARHRPDACLQGDEKRYPLSTALLEGILCAARTVCLAPHETHAKAHIVHQDEARSLLTDFVIWAGRFSRLPPLSEGLLDDLVVLLCRSRAAHNHAAQIVLMDALVASRDSGGQDTPGDVYFTDCRARQRQALPVHRRCLATVQLVAKQQRLHRRLPTAPRLVELFAAMASTDQSESTMNLLQGIARQSSSIASHVRASLAFSVAEQSLWGASLEGTPSGGRCKRYLREEPHGDICGDGRDEPARLLDSRALRGAILANVERRYVEVIHFFMPEESRMYADLLSFPSTSDSDRAVNGPAHEGQTNGSIGTKASEGALAAGKDALSLLETLVRNGDPQLCLLVPFFELMRWLLSRGFWLEAAPWIERAVQPQEVELPMPPVGHDVPKEEILATPVDTFRHVHFHTTADDFLLLRLWREVSRPPRSYVGLVDYFGSPDVTIPLDARRGMERMPETTVEDARCSTKRFVATTLAKRAGDGTSVVHLAAAQQISQSH